MLSLKITAHALHKAGTETRLYEDAYAFDEASGRAAVAGHISGEIAQQLLGPLFAWAAGSEAEMDQHLGE